MIKRGFTLAEVLVTLLVIGVIAALTIPQLINSTEERQYKTAYKKAVSSIANATELMEANEVSCSVSNSSDLAKCMKNAMKGTVTNDAGEPDENGNVLVTQDGMAFMFYLPGNYENEIINLQNSNANYKAPKRAISKICPSFTYDSNYFVPDDYDGWSEKNCTVFVDLDGFGKNSTGFYNFSTNEDYWNAGDIQVMGFSGKGEVRPVYIHEPDADLAINKGYKYMYGEEAFEKLQENYEPPIDCWEICCGDGRNEAQCNDNCAGYEYQYTGAFGCK
ncbi:MAG: type II secretion system GspH family protein [bacterium]|nr:type II secretion system GspH family protein [bacterium]